MASNDKQVFENAVASPRMFSATQSTPMNKPLFAKITTGLLAVIISLFSFHVVLELSMPSGDIMPMFMATLVSICLVGAANFFVLGQVNPKPYLKKSRA
ncbi:hypothetical protein [Vibrio breoganii]|uniref:hypothetical protein n=1 Tax=Vibrio breoganii TaxID=553239 RepID=UPI0021C2F49E|nr:hypothetical protein [Vibrio breoganii]MDN3715116.1 hypothetical protein [Vibrio breoganii]